MIKLKRVYEEAQEADGRRYLVERLWPRGIKKEGARLSAWLKDLSPSPDLRRWYGHDRALWEGFRLRYEGELAGPEKEETLWKLAKEAERGPVTFVFAAKDEAHSSAKVLQDWIEKNYLGGPERTE